MGFELSIAAKRDPLEGRNIGEPMSRPRYAAITLNGVFDDDALQAVMRTVSELFGDGAGSILIDMNDVRADDAACLGRFASGLMTFRSDGCHVQVVVRYAALHAEMAQIENSRDWLITSPDANVEEARHAVHLDGPPGPR